MLAEKEREKWQHTERPKVDFTMFKYGQPQPAPELPSEISCSIGEAISYIRKGAYGDAHAMFHTALEQTLAEAERRVLAQVKYGAKE